MTLCGECRYWNKHPRAMKHTRARCELFSNEDNRSDETDTDLPVDPRVTITVEHGYSAELWTAFNFGCVAGVSKSGNGDLQL